MLRRFSSLPNSNVTKNAFKSLIEPKSTVVPETVNKTWNNEGKGRIQNAEPRVQTNNHFNSSFQNSQRSPGSASEHKPGVGQHKHSNPFRSNANPKFGSGTGSENGDWRGRGRAVKPSVKQVPISGPISAKDLAGLMEVRAVDVLKVLLRLGEEPRTVHHQMSQDVAQVVVSEFGFEPVLPPVDSEIQSILSDGSVRTLLPRPPIVAIMGHVDHGKTTLLDYIRHSHRADHEAGAITQTVAAFACAMPHGFRATFLDTPGHAAFARMRERGAKVTDLGIVVIAGNDGVKEQTVEAITHLQKANIPLLIAISKSDLPEYRSGDVKKQLLQYNIVVEDFGGEVPVVEISSKTGQGIEELESMLQLQSEMQEIKGAHEGRGRGVVIDSSMAKGLGVITSIVVKDGCLNVGDYFVCGSTWGRVKSLLSDGKNQVKSAAISNPIDVVGFTETAPVGETLYVVKSIEDAQLVAQKFAEMKSTKHRKELKEGQLGVNFVVKADSAAALQAFATALEESGNDEVRGVVVHTGVGAVSDFDVDTAEATHSQILYFGSAKVSAVTQRRAHQGGVQIWQHNVIYKLLDHVGEILLDALPPITEELTIGTAEVLQIFQLSGKSRSDKTYVTGCRVLEGAIKANLPENALEVRKGNECGIILENYQECQPGDTIVCFEKKVTKRSALAPATSE